jgi:hypothetical protein
MNLRWNKKYPQVGKKKKREKKHKKKQQKKIF